MSAHSELDCPLNRLAIGIANRKDGTREVCIFGFSVAISYNDTFLQPTIQRQEYLEALLQGWVWNSGSSLDKSRFAIQFCTGILCKKVFSGVL